MVTNVIAGLLAGVFAGLAIYWAIRLVRGRGDIRRRPVVDVPGSVHAMGYSVRRPRLGWVVLRDRMVLGGQEFRAGDIIVQGVEYVREQAIWGTGEVVSHTALPAPEMIVAIRDGSVVLWREFNEMVTYSLRQASSPTLLQVGAQLEAVASRVLDPPPFVEDETFAGLVKKPRPVAYGGPRRTRYDLIGGDDLF
jgi:hypothetical protein